VFNFSFSELIMVGIIFFIVAAAPRVGGLGAWLAGKRQGEKG
jgi:Sec-independent protein translocase protein TatA